ncbi:MAG: hypothetical protein AB8B93_11070 [Pseudomonadales bacterium]
MRCGWLLLALAGLCVLASGCAQASDPTDQTGPSYKSWFRAELLPEQGIAQAYVRIEQDAAQVKRLTLRMPAARYTLGGVDGQVVRDGDTVVWQVPADGGRLRYQYVVANKRDNGAFDARLSAAGALLRGDDLFPPAAALTEDGAHAIARVRIDVPDDWSVQTQYGRANNRSRRVQNPARRFDRPTGWIIAGKLGVRIDKIAERTVVTAGFRNEPMRRNDILAFMRWNLPELIKVTGRFPERLLMVGADDPFWRGGLSGSRSFYLHVDRPMISENGTSTVLHELTHVATGLRAKGQADWIVEGLAEYYSLEIMRRTNTISQQRFDDAIAGLTRWSADVDDIATDRSAGAVTARAVVALHKLAEELKQTHNRSEGLDPIMRALSQGDAPVTLAQFKKLAREQVGTSRSPALAALLALAS